MELIHAVVYGIVQGFTAYLPISSDAHIRLVAAMLGWQDEGPTFTAFTAVIQLGPTLAVTLYFWKDIVAALKGWAVSLKDKEKDSVDARLTWGVIWGTIPILILGVLLQKPIETKFRSLDIIAGSLILIGIVMYFADRKAHEKRTSADIQVKDGIIVGLWQCLALIPGMSRSGSTISGSLFQGFDRLSAARFAFLMGIPSFTAAGIYEAARYHHQLIKLMAPLAIAFVISFVVGYACLAWFLKFLQTKGVAPFVMYRIALGIIIIVLVHAKTLDANAGAKPLPPPTTNAIPANP